MNNPDFIIIGETKCGTTSFYNYLIQHPKILETYGNGDDVDPSYATKEVRYFDRYFSRGYEWYQSCFPETQEDEITGEADGGRVHEGLEPGQLDFAQAHVGDLDGMLREVLGKTVVV